jgi:hypothetical protein
VNLMNDSIFGARHLALVVACATGGLALVAGAAEPAFRHRASIAVVQPASFVQLTLPASAYERSAQAELRDLRVVDATGARVPFALLQPRVAQTVQIDRLRDAAVYPLPPRPVDGRAWAAPVEISMQGSRVDVKLRPGQTAASPTNAPGWLIDTGERTTSGPLPRALRFAWPAGADFSAAFEFESSDDLRQWRAGGSGQLMALNAATGPLTQPTLELAPTTGRFVRLVWADAAAAPRLSGAKVVAAQPQSVVFDAPTELQFAASAEPTSQAAPGTATPQRDELAARALHFDLGGNLPLVAIDLQLAAGTRVAPVRVQSRSRLDQPWQQLADAVVYRLERGASVSHSPPIVVQASARYLRVVPDERSAALAPGATRLLVRATLASLVFASQGQQPFTLLAGSADAPAGALPIGTLVPALDEERPRFGRATVGEWREVAAVAERDQRQQREAALRPWLLWAVLLAGVGGLGFMVWRLLVKGAAPAPSGSSPAAPRDSRG